MNVTMLREALERLEQEGLGGSDLYVFPTDELHDASQQRGQGSVVRFDFGEYPIEGVNANFTQPEDAQAILIEFGKLGPTAGRAALLRTRSLSDGSFRVTGTRRHPRAEART